MKQLLIDTTHEDETVIIKTNNDKIESINYEFNGVKKGNIYYGKISHIDLALNAVFVNFGSPKTGFLSIDNIHISYFKNQERNINNLYKDQSIMVQIEKEARENKGAFLTTYICLLGRYCVFMVDSKMGTGGISKKINDSKERERLNNIKEKINLPNGINIIFRTAGVNASLLQIKKDFNGLNKIWNNINSNFHKTNNIMLAYEEDNGIKKALREYYSSDIEYVKVLNEKDMKIAKKFAQLFISKNQINISLMNDRDYDFFYNKQFDEYINNLAARKINLPSKGYINITKTEALISIDINSGKSKQNAFEVNKEAISEIINQIFLKELSGIIVIDLIDMQTLDQYEVIEKMMKVGLELDKARIKIAKINNLGLLEISRQRINTSIYDWLLQSCKHCYCSGALINISFIGKKMLRNLYHAILSRNSLIHCSIIASKEICLWLMNEKKYFIQSLEMDFKVKIKLVCLDYCQREHYRFEWS